MRWRRRSAASSPASAYRSTGDFAERLETDRVQVSANLAAALRPGTGSRRDGIFARAHSRCRRWRRRVELEHRVLKRRSKAADVGEGSTPGEQLVEHRSERIHIRSRCDRLAAKLLRTGIGGREHARLGAGRGEALLRLRVDELRNAEIEQARAPIAVDQQVVGLEIAVDDALRVRESDGVEHVEEELHPRRNRERLLTRPADQIDSVDELDSQKPDSLG